MMIQLVFNSQHRVCWKMDLTKVALKRSPFELFLSTVTKTEVSASPAGSQGLTAKKPHVPIGVRSFSIAGRHQMTPERTQNFGNSSSN